MFFSLLGLLCVLCGQRMPPRESRLPLCGHCASALPWRATPLEHAGMRVIAPLEYAGYARDWVLAAKRSHGLVEARVLGSLLAASVEQAYPHADARPAGLIPVPLSLPRLLRRGHNQATLIAKPVARRLGIPIRHDAVRRRRHTRIQPGLSSAERTANVQGAFEARARFDGQTLAIVDDVLTSGATVAALAACLRDAGAREVHVWCATAAPHGCDDVRAAGS